MAVYVDNVHIPARVGRHESTWCHLTADSSEELIAFALRLGLKERYIQYPGTYKEHFDVTASKRAQAVRLGAVEEDALDGARRRSLARRAKEEERERQS